MIGILQIKPPSCNEERFNPQRRGHWIQACLAQSKKMLWRVTRGCWEWGLIYITVMCLEHGHHVCHRQVRLLTISSLQLLGKNSYEKFDRQYVGFGVQIVQYLKGKNSTIVVLSVMCFTYAT